MPSESRTMVALTPALMEELDRQASELSLSRSSMIRMFVKQGLEEKRNQPDRTKTGKAVYNVDRKAS
jgi:metal-responsive CopG/Arc/MetJ family transcriptional regulator